MSAQNLTYLQIVNKVLPRLREATVAAVTTTTYSSFIGELVNQVKEEIENAWHWYALRDTFTVNTSATVSSYTLTGAGRGSVILDGWNTSAPGPLTPGTNRSFNQKFFGETTPATGRPTQYLVSGFDSAYDLTIDVWPVPTATANALKFNVYQPQDDLSAGSDVPSIPSNVLIEGVYARALAERGDDGGDAGQRAEAVYQNLLASAVARDAAYDPTEVDWAPV